VECDFLMDCGCWQCLIAEEDHAVHNLAMTYPSLASHMTKE